MFQNYYFSTQENNTRLHSSLHSSTPSFQTYIGSLSPTVTHAAHSWVWFLFYFDHFFNYQVTGDSIFGASSWGKLLKWSPWPWKRHSCLITHDTILQPFPSWKLPKWKPLFLLKNSKNVFEMSNSAWGKIWRYLENGWLAPLSNS